MALVPTRIGIIGTSAYYPDSTVYTKVAIVGGLTTPPLTGSSAKERTPLPPPPPPPPSPGGGYDPDEHVYGYPIPARADKPVLPKPVWDFLSISPRPHPVLPDTWLSVVLSYAHASGYKYLYCGCNRLACSKRGAINHLFILSGYFYTWSLGCAIAKYIYIRCMKHL